ncbi:hypothetical protein GQ600_17737 [Phytophthora cactorum]|nr:hypothetical protein GQ600_17737 [Phytophthora cactorum]
MMKMSGRNYSNDLVLTWRLCTFVLANTSPIWSCFHPLHKVYLNERLPPIHMFSTSFYATQNQPLFEWLRQRVTCPIFRVNDPISPSGIPSHVGIMVILMAYKTGIDEMKKDLAVTFEKS